MTIPLAQTVGIENVRAIREEIWHLRKITATTLHLFGSRGETTLLNLTAAYGMLVNGGKGSGLL